MLRKYFHNLLNNLRGGMQFEISKEIAIRLSIREVWEILISTQEYPKWNPFFTEIKGEFVPNQRIQIKMQAKGEPIQVFNPVVQVVDEKEFRIRWIGQLEIKGYKADWLFHGDHSLQLTKIDANTTLITNFEKFSGLLVYVLKSKLRGSYSDSFEAMNLALKKHAEDTNQKLANSKLESDSHNSTERLPNDPGKGLTLFSRNTSGIRQSDTETDRQVVTNFKTP